MLFSLNIGETVHIRWHDFILTVKCVADEPNESPNQVCNRCIFAGFATNCSNIDCEGRHYEFIDRKEVE